MKILFVILGCLFGLNSYAMDIKKIYKVHFDPKKPYERQIHKAIEVQMPNYPEHQYLHKIKHPCCKDVPRA